MLCAAPRPDIVIADFEGADYGTWWVEGTAFGKAPARGTLPGQMRVSGFKGKGLVNSFNGGEVLAKPPRDMGVPPMKHGQDARATPARKGFCRIF